MNLEGRLRYQMQKADAAVDEARIKAKATKKRLLEKAKRFRKPRTEDHISAPSPDSREAFDELLQTISIINAHVPPGADFGEKGADLAQSSNYTPRMKALLRFGSIVTNHQSDPVAALDQAELHLGVLVDAQIPPESTNVKETPELSTTPEPETEPVLIVGFIGKINAGESTFCTGIALRLGGGVPYPVGVSVAENGVTKVLPSILFMERIAVPELVIRNAIKLRELGTGDDRIS